MKLTTDGVKLRIRDPHALQYDIDSKWDNKAAENQTENTQNGNCLKEDIQKTLKQINGKK